MAENKAKEYKAIEELKGIHNTSDAVLRESRLQTVGRPERW